MSRMLSFSSVMLLVFVVGFSSTASARCGFTGVRWGGNFGWHQPVVAYVGENCSNYPQGPHCAPGLVCMSSPYQMGFGVCQYPGWSNGGGHCGNGVPNGNANGGGFWYPETE